MNAAAWQITVGHGPLVAAAIHDGHALRPEAAANMVLDTAERRREEDPFTAHWTALAPTRIVGLRSRFEVDLNRPRDAAVYRTPADCWNLQVWRETPSEAFLARSLEIYDGFYQAVTTVIEELLRKHPRVLVYDLHSYNHRRDGAEREFAPAAENPEINVGTGTMDREYWSPIVDRFLHDLRSYEENGRRLDVRENIKFRGGQFSRWLHTTYPGRVCALAVEVKKFFMNEWTGEPDEAQLQWVGRALESTTPGMLELLEQFPRSRFE